MKFIVLLTVTFLTLGLWRGEAADLPKRSPPQVGAAGGVGKCRIPSEFSRQDLDVIFVDPRLGEVSTKLKRRYEVKLMSNQQQKFYQFTEYGELFLEKALLNRYVNSVVPNMKGILGESCQFSVTGTSGTAFWGAAPRLEFMAEGKGRKCSRVEYPCGEFKCDIVNSLPHCELKVKYCEMINSFDIGNWRIDETVNLSVALNQETSSISVEAIPGDRRAEKEAIGDVLKIIEDLGIERRNSTLMLMLTNAFEINGLMASMCRFPVLFHSHWW